MEFAPIPRLALQLTSRSKAPTRESLQLPDPKGKFKPPNFFCNSRSENMLDHHHPRWPTEGVLPGDTKCFCVCFSPRKSIPYFLFFLLLIGNNLLFSRICTYNTWGTSLLSPSTLFRPQLSTVTTLLMVPWTNFSLPQIMTSCSDCYF